MKINITADIPDDYVNIFCSFLSDMERNGIIGHTARMLFIADGDGDFRPKINIDTEFNHVDPQIEDCTVIWDDCPVTFTNEVYV